MGQYIELTKENFEEVVKNGLSLVDFWAPWCGPCRMLSPVIDKLAQDYSGVANICKVNTDEQEELSAQFGIRSIPTILFLKDGKVVDQMVGATSEQVLKDKLDSLK
ncbi:thioredoxin [Helicobacter kayseriensis]|uniref:thioredoxin n=1 Tax=Helicobacter kayseriensis TaxID=2905877 RepID=UPI001E336E78|nr:thioredoxin [Helicobacter kayseriensis]MCE3046960.1 thioredoxin [Helicobacter kayseriensis]MCE3048380.1 thioredoxin [Helicobacter kayseriensis]